MNRLIVVLAIAIATQVFPSYGQNQKAIDSLLSIVTAQSGASKFPALYELTFEYALFDKARALDCIEEARMAADLSGDSLWIIRSIRVKAFLLAYLGRMTESAFVARSIEDCPSLVQFPDEHHGILTILFNANTYMSQFDRALEYSLKALDVAHEARNAQYEVESLMNIGFVYYKLRDYDKAIGYYERGRRLAATIGLNDPMSGVNVSLCYSHLFDFGKARTYLNEAVSICRDECTPEAMLHINYAAGCIYFGQGEYHRAEGSFLMSLGLARKIGLTRLELDNIYMLARIYVQQDSLLKARELLSAGEQIILSGSPFNLEMIKVYDQLAELFSSTNDLERAFFYQSKYLKLKDSIYNDALTASLMRIESEYIRRQGREVIEAQQQVIELKNALLHRQRTFNVLSWLFVMLAAVVIFFLFKNHQKNKTLNILLDQRVQERTKELEVSRSELAFTLREQKLAIGKAATGIVQHASTVRGLCCAAKGEMDTSHVWHYFDKIQVCVGHIEGCLKIGALKNFSDC